MEWSKFNKQDINYLDKVVFRKPLSRGYSYRFGTLLVVHNETPKSQFPGDITDICVGIKDGFPVIHKGEYINMQCEGGHQGKHYDLAITEDLEYLKIN